MANNLKQLALAALNHHEVAGHFPTGGWGWFWVGDPDRGFSKKQPGGWIFNLMPFTEESSRYDAAADGDAEKISPQQLDAVRELVVNPLPLIDCPSRRPGQVFPKPIDGLFIGYNSAKNPSNANIAGRSDYAINAGDQGGTDPIDCWYLAFPGGAKTPQPDYNIGGELPLAHQRAGLDDPYRRRAREIIYTGVSFQRSEVAAKHITDGTSRTYLIGERFLDITDYETGRDGGDNETWCTGYNNDNFRSAFDPPAQDRILPPVNLCCQGNIFGSVHPAGWYVSWCDGHVELIGYDVDLQVHRANANRADDGQPNTTPARCPNGGI